MKKFYTTIPQQPAGKLKLCQYKNPGASPLLDYGETRFPVIPLVANAAQKGEHICLYCIKPAYENTNIWEPELRGELDALSKKNGFTYDIDVHDIPRSEVVGNHLELFRWLVGKAADNDRIYADITYGTKPVPIILLMSMNYAYRYRKNVEIESIVYGAVDHGAGESSLYDVSALFYMNATVSTMGHDPAKAIEMLLDLGKEEE